MNPKQELILLTARDCIGTPWQHQGRLANVGLDCIGLICVVANVLGMDYKDSATYRRIPHNGELEKALNENLIIIDEQSAQPGDIIAMHLDGEPCHVGLLSNYGIIHADYRVGRVVETVLDDTTKSKITGWYRFK
jgi:cell wall-associated NlpC family hydrolase